MTSTAETHTYLDLSTAHLPQALVNQDGGLNAIPGVVSYPYEHGEWLWVPVDVDEWLADWATTGPIPGEIASLWRYARGLGCDFVRLDADGATNDALPTYTDTW